MQAPSGRTAPSSDLKDDHGLLCEVTREAGALALDYFQTDVERWKKEDKTPVSEADLAVDALLSERLLAARPDYGWLSEETDDDPERLGKRRVWLVDPIDGTRAFLKGRPHFTVSVALAVDGAPVAGAIFNPALDEFYEAILGGGARLNGRALAVSGRKKLAGCKMAAFQPMFRHPAWPEPWPEMRFVERNSVAYRLALVASGEADAALSLSSKWEWDVAAGDLIVREAGGRVATHTGAPLAYNRPMARHRSMVAAGPALYEKLHARICAITLPD